jgi:hypothetical protein
VSCDQDEACEEVETEAERGLRSDDVGGGANGRKEVFTVGRPWAVHGRESSRLSGLETADSIWLLSVHIGMLDVSARRGRRWVRFTGTNVIIRR